MTKTRELALTGVFAALYASLVYALAGISFELVQIRVADALIPLSMIFGWPAVVGVTVGCIVANVITPFSTIVDIVGGSVANFIASFLAWKIGTRYKTRKSEFIGCLAATMVLAIIVGTYLALLTGIPIWLWWLSIFAGSFVSINILGYTLIQILKRTRIVAK